MDPPKCCPQCKLKSSLKDIRIIFAAKIRVIDNSRELELERKIETLSHEKTKLITEMSLTSMQLAIQKKQNRDLQVQLESLKMMAHSSSTVSNSMTIRTKTYRMHLDKNIDMKESSESRLITYISRSKKLIVTQKAVGNTLFSNGFGLRTIDFTTYRSEKFLNTGSKLIVDMSIDSSETYVITAARESTCKMFNLSSCQTVGSFTPAADANIWCCAFDPDRTTQLLLGAQNGYCYFYDTRKSSEVLKEIPASESNRTPIKYIIPMKKSEDFPLGGCFIVHLKSVYFYEYLPTMEHFGTKLNIDEPIKVMTYDERTEMVLFITSPSEQSRQSRVIQAKLVKVDGVSVLQEIYSFDGSISVLAAISRPSQIKMTDNNLIATYLQDTKMLQLWTANSGRTQEIAISDGVTDTCTIYADNGIFLSALSSQKCRLFKINGN